MGQEPGWLLEIDSAALTLVTDYGGDTLALPLPEPVRDAAASTVIYRASAQGRVVHVTIRDESCEDTMSGERFSLTVTVVLDSRTFSGCGRELEADR